MAKDYNFGISYANGSSHGTMICINCGKKVNSGAYFHCENEFAYKVTHRKCATTDKVIRMFDKFDLDNSQELERLMGMYSKYNRLFEDYGYMKAKSDADYYFEQWRKLKDLIENEDNNNEGV